ncbi:glycoside hydrolase family 95 protein [Postia placenta MAD-698-R-SB12]|uniref:Glycoside hydrolase family 95 protein n=1 Tax=Postia placenta MAD-698-R-SB12 TaxID=670580 RepID=A0A1X6N137_9APHY|nr:glycoside hydrolase family 95 protein [Postia placenta MAD-698-R-SB12]OSX62210.1 glycoside hydrolase family 95 protein [Postia placenta MAD-698-R-SB12]
MTTKYARGLNNNPARGKKLNTLPLTESAIPELSLLHLPATVFQAYINRPTGCTLGSYGPWSFMPPGRARQALTVGLTSLISLVASAPPGFPTSGNGLWYTSPGASDAWSTEWLPIGNGYLAATMPGETIQETMHVNVESLWSGGPMQDPSYNGGNMLPSQQSTMAEDMQAYRQAIFASANGTINNIEELMTPAGAYARVRASSGSSISCIPNGVNATLSVEGAGEAWITWVGGTNYDMYTGNAANDFSFAGTDPHASLVSLISAATEPSVSYAALFNTHVADYAGLMSPFSLSLGQTPDFATPTDQLVAAYQTNVGNPYLEWVLFNYGAFATFVRAAVKFKLVPSSQITNTWAPRGAETAQILYNISRGWVTHDEMNVRSLNIILRMSTSRFTQPKIFGHTGMKLSGNSAQWADYPGENPRFYRSMIHVWDHFDYTNNVMWFKEQGWPLLKGVAQFHLDKLIADLHFNDSTLVTNPCNSPEQAPITFVFLRTKTVTTYAGYTSEVQEKQTQMDKGIHIGSWGQLQGISTRSPHAGATNLALSPNCKEWKVDMDSPTDTHRHLSHLIGLYPGYAITSYDPAVQNGSMYGYSRSDVLAAAEVSLFHRGNGTGPDADAGWEKVWRAACWAQLANASEFYFELTYAVERNFASNLFDIYTPNSGPDGVFQIDANFGYPAALLAPDVASYSTPLVVTVLPALPAAWPSGSIKGARLRGGLTLDLEWANGKPTALTITVDQNVVARPVEIVYSAGTVASFTTSGGLTKAVGF